MILRQNCGPKKPGTMLTYLKLKCVNSAVAEFSIEIEWKSVLLTNVHTLCALLMKISFSMSNVHVTCELCQYYT